MWIVIYHFLTLISAIPQAGFSDVYGRKKHLLISLISVTLAAAYVVFAYLAKLHHLESSYFPAAIFTVIPVCIFLGISGNTIPIARAAIADLKIHDFRTAIGWSTTFIGFGWITSIMLGLILPPVGVLMFAILLQTSIVFIVKYYFFDLRDSDEVIKHKHNWMNTIFSSYKWFISMFLVSGGAAALFAYLCTETTFYQIYSINEEGEVNLGDKVTGLLMAFGYAFGVIAQWIIYCSDKKGIKFGITFSFLSLSILFIFKFLLSRELVYLSFNTSYLIEGILNFLFALGFGFFVPSLFSLMATKINAHHAGRLFGAIDITDTLALGISSFSLFLREKIHFEDLLIYSLLLCFFIIAGIFYKNFIRRFSTYEKLYRK
jgi:MFS family permease